MEFYFDMEIGYEDPEKIERLRKGENASFRPEDVKIITIQYQQLNPVGRLRILKEWESSEEDIIKKFAAIMHPKNAWDFIPVGHNVYFDIGLFTRRARIYGIDYDDWFIYHDMPAIDIKHICIGMNNFEFKNSGLDKFTGKETSGAMVPVWYADKDYQKIIDYVEKETKEFVNFYLKLKKAMPEFRKEHGFY